MPLNARRSPLALSAAACLLPALLGGGCASAPAPAARTALTVTVPHVERLDVSECMGSPAAINHLLSTRAESFAQLIDHGSVWYGEGGSMEPLLEPGSWIVTKPHPYTDLQPGMVVLYASASGRPIVHALVRRTSRGWIAAGVNNRSADREFVTPTNLAGVIAGVFVPAAN